jgi:hypothetical protein
MVVLDDASHNRQERTRMSDAAVVEPATPSAAIPSNPERARQLAVLEAARKAKAEKKAAQDALARERLHAKGVTPADEQASFLPTMDGDLAGYHSWTAFCNAVSIQLMFTPQGHAIMASFGNSDSDIAQGFVGFYGNMAKAYKAMRLCHKKGVEEFGA